MHSSLGFFWQIVWNLSSTLHPTPWHMDFVERVVILNNHNTAALPKQGEKAYLLITQKF